MADSNAPRRRLSKSSKSTDSPPSKMELKQLLTTKLRAPFYYAESFFSCAEMARDIILTAEVPFLMKARGELVPLSGREVRITMRMSPHTARRLLRSLRLAIEQLEEQEKAQEKHERRGKESARRFWKRVVVPQLAKSKSNGYPI